MILCADVHIQRTRYSQLVAAQKVVELAKRKPRDFSFAIKKIIKLLAQNCMPANMAKNRDHAANRVTCDFKQCEPVAL